MGSIERSAREVAGDVPRETFEKAVVAAAKAVCAHRSYRMIAAEVLASVNYAGAVEENERLEQAIRMADENLGNGVARDDVIRFLRSHLSGGQ